MDAFFRASAQSDCAPTPPFCARTRSRSSGAPMTITSPAPDSRARAAIDWPTGPAPSTTTESSSRMSARSIACTAVTSPQPPPMNVSGARPSGSRIIFTPGFIQIRSAQPPSGPSSAP